MGAVCCLLPLEKHKGGKSKHDEISFLRTFT